jgi:hypothetical protein
MMLVDSIEYLLSVDVVTKQSWLVISHDALITWSLLPNGGPTDI